MDQLMQARAEIDRIDAELARLFEARMQAVEGVIAYKQATGMPVLVKAAFKPTPSISRPQHTVDFKNRTDAILEIKGRHDPCVVPRAVPCVEAAVAIAMASFLIHN